MSASASSPAAAEEKQEAAAAPVTHCKGVNDLEKVVLREVRGSSAEVRCLSMPVPTRTPPFPGSAN
jgi:glucose-6-phosphate 1-epimerase